MARRRAARLQTGGVDRDPLRLGASRGEVMLGLRDLRLVRRRPSEDLVTLVSQL